MSKEKVYFPMEPMIDEYPHCCGIEVVTEIVADEPYAGESSLDKCISKEALFEDFIKKVNKRRTDRHLQLCFVKRRKGTKHGDVPDGFQEFLESKGWYVIDEFVNPNHGNKLCVMGKTYARAKKPPPFRPYYW